MGSNPSVFRGADLPVESVNWNHAKEFCEKLTLIHHQAGLIPEDWRWTLPTEAQWEYACRAGTTADFAGDLDEMAWYDKIAGEKTHAVKGKRANAWGLYDMYGNVWEWCSDRYGYYPTTSATDPTGPSDGSDAVLRGGSWIDNVRGCRSASRYELSQVFGDRYYGFRVCLVRVPAGEAK